MISAPAYLEAMDDAGVRSELRTAAAALDPDDAAALTPTAEHLRQLVRKAGVPGACVEGAVLNAYHRLGAGIVAVRSSATAEDRGQSSFAGMHETFTNVVGDDALIERVVDCWASLFGERVLAYRASQGITDEPAIAVVVQPMVDSERSGVMFTADPRPATIDGRRDRGRLRAGRGVVGGQVEPDTYVVDKDGPRSLDVRIGHKTLQDRPRRRRRRARRARRPSDADRRVLSDDEVLALARLGLARRGPLRRAAGHRVGDRRAARSSSCSRGRSPRSAGGRRRPARARPAASRSCTRARRRRRASAAGAVRVLRSPAEGAALQPGEVLVAPMTNPDWVPIDAPRRPRSSPTAAA